jgi:hypothetical protein
MDHMRSDTQTITVEAAPDDVAAFLADGANLPRWAIGFARNVRRDGDRWVVATAEGEVPTVVDAHDAARVIDFRMEPAPGVDAVAHVRVLPNGDGSEVVFTQFQRPGLPDGVFDHLVAAVRHELVALKAILEVGCPL